MATILILEGDLVVNIAVPDPTGQWQPPQGQTVVTSFPPDVGIGWRRSATGWVAPVYDRTTDTWVPATDLSVDTITSTVGL